MSRRGQLDGKGAGARPLRALGLDAPDVERRVEELLGRDGVLVRQALALAVLAPPGPVEAALARDHDALAHVAQHRVRGEPYEPHAQEPLAPSALDPDDLAAKEEAEVVLQDRDDVGCERP